MRDAWGLHTEDCACRHWFFIYPEGHLGEDYCHYAGDIRLNHEVAHFTFQVEIDRHHHIFTWRINRNELVWLTKNLKLHADRFQLIQLQTDVTFDFIWSFLHTADPFSPKWTHSTHLNFLLLKSFFGGGSFSIYVNRKALWNTSTHDVYDVWLQEAGTVVSVQGSVLQIHSKSTTQATFLQDCTAFLLKESRFYIL